MRIKKTWIGIAAVPLALLVGTGIALAAWTVSGSGSGTAAGAGTQSLVIAGVAPAVGSLFPGGPAGSVDLTIDNPNPYPVNVTSITWGAPNSPNTALCANNNLSIDAGASPSSTVNFTIPANTTSPTEVVPGVIDMASTAPQGCANLDFTVPVTAVIGTQQP
jgi:hypothetical protein